MKNLSLKHVFIVSSALASMLLALNIIVLVYVGDVTQKSFGEIESVTVPSIVYLHELWANGLQTEQATRNIILNPKDQNALKNYNDANAEFTKALSETERLNPSLREFVGKVGALWSKAHTLRLKAQELAFTNDGTGAFDLINKQETPLWREIKSLIASQIKTSKAEFNSSFSANSKLLRDSNISIESLAAFLFVMINAIMFVLWRKISKPLFKVIGFAGKVASGQLGEELDVNQKDEFGKVADSLRMMVASLRDMIATAKLKTDEAQRQTALAREATSEAQEAKEKAECAKAEGMLHAANQLEGVVQVVKTASERLSAHVSHCSTRTHTQTERVGETATAMEEMNATVLEVAKNASHAAETAESAKSRAESGASIVSQVVGGMTQLQEQALELRSNMTTLGTQAQGIGQVMNVINDIADQTNLLALNAAIEAARAGEAGRGFAVVADEVRKLAEKTMTATKEVGEAITTIQDGTRLNVSNVERTVTTINSATELATQSGESLKEIVALVEMASDQVRSIATASEEQSAASEEINHSIEDINRISTENSDAMRQSAEAVEELTNQSHVLGRLIEEMQSEGGGNPR